jgi:uncharacterized protein (TIGR02265 family)
VTLSLHPARNVDVERVHAKLGLDSRLSLVPSHAQVRGFLFKQTADEVGRHGSAAAVAHRRLSPVKSTWFFRMYPVREYLLDIAAAAAVLSPEDPGSAVRAIWRNAPKYAALFNASRFLGLLGTDVLAAVEWLESNRHFFADYGRWHLEPRGPGYFIMHYFDEWIWIDTAHRGGMESVLEACGRPGTADVELVTPYDGRIHVRWQAL